MSEDLKPCPFCSGPAQLASGGPGLHYVRCKGCKASSDDRWGERAVTLWNARAESSAEIGKLRAALDEAKAGLLFYADPKIYEPHPHGPAFDRRDVSFKAKAVLEKIEGLAP